MRILLGAILLVGLAVGQAHAEQAKATQQPNCQIEDTNLQMVERDRKGHERKLAALAVQLQMASERIAELTKALAAAKAPKDEKKAE